MPKRPCLSCNTLTHGTRCGPCEAGRQHVRNMSRAHYRGDYKANAQAVRDAANADPTARCWRCGRPARAGDPWQAGHLRDGDPTSPLAAEHRSCNARAGQALAQG